MPKSGIHLSFFLLLFLLNSSCRDKTSVSIKQISSSPKAISAFDAFLKSINEEPEANDSLIKYNFENAKSLLEVNGQLLLYRKMGEDFYNKEIPDSALVYFQKGLKIANTAKNTYYTSVSHMMCGSVYTNNSDFEHALKELKFA
jgi:hypothetical protein